MGVSAYVYSQIKNIVCEDTNDSTKQKNKKMQQIKVKDLGLIDYKEAWDFQEQLFKKTIDIKIQNRKDNTTFATENHLLFCEHPHVYTLGKSGNEAHLLLSEAMLKQKGATYYKINRGGDITYHGPRQIVGYPILDLDNFFTDIHKYLRFLEEIIIRTLAEYGIAAGRYEGYTGVWLDADNPQKARKICAMGVRCSRWVTMHGFAFNVHPDLSYFGNIIPCGIDDKQVTSLQKELGREVNMEEVKEKLKKHFAALFEAEIVINQEA
ncbi:MAG: lipoyl(octanoyl) transferase LipB [Vicingaceae bacterium]|nr:lipoyl(octanoyl) transferase LipB [Vicingaceae bacterium]